MNYLMTVIFALICFQCPAQLKGFSIGPYAELAWPTGKLEETNKNGFGAGVNADVRFGKLGLTGSVGFIHFAGRTLDKIEGPVNLPAINAIPLRAGLKYRIIPLIYIKLEGGVAQYTNGDGSAFILAPGIGVRVLMLDAEMKYEVWKKESTTGFWGLKFGYNF